MKGFNLFSIVVLPTVTKKPFNLWNALEDLSTNILFVYRQHSRYQVVFVINYQRNSIDICGSNSEGEHSQNV